MEVMYSNIVPELFQNNSITGIYGDKIDLVKNNIDFDGGGFYE